MHWQENPPFRAYRDHWRRDFGCKPSSANYVIDEEAAKALREVINRYGEKSAEQPVFVSTSNVVFETNDEDYMLTPSNNLTLSGALLLVRPTRLTWR